MKMSGVCIGIILGLTMFGCSSQEEPAKSKETVSPTQVKQEAKEAAEATQKLLVQEHEKLMKGIDDKLAAYDKDVKEMWKKTQEAAADVIPQVQKEMEEFQKNLDAAKKKMAAWRSASGKAWEEMKSGMDAAMVNLDKAYEKAKSHLK